MWAIVKHITCREVGGLMANACADPERLGFSKLYVMLLEHSKHQIALAVHLLADAEKFPVLIHCIHGCALHYFLPFYALLLARLSSFRTRDLMRCEAAKHMRHSPNR
jgi:hypothetical protein